jgi:hypothetical protein
MVQKIQPWGIIWVSSNRPQAGHLSEKNDDLAVQYVHGYLLSIKINTISANSKNPRPSIYTN